MHRNGFEVPWNALYWITVLGMFAFAIIFGVLSEMEHDELLGVDDDRTLELKEGDMVTVVLLLNGDEVVVEKDGLRARARMLGIKSFDPVVNEREITAYGHASMTFLRRWMLDKEVTVHFDDPKHDVQGRFLVYFEWNNVDINERMLAEGVSMAYTEFPFEREQAYLAAEISARAIPAGVWGNRKARRRIEALRQDWAAARTGRGDKSLVDPLLEARGPGGKR